MPTNFPGGLDIFPSAATLAAQTLGTSPHSVLHGNLGDAIAAVEAYVLANVPVNVPAAGGVILANLVGWYKGDQGTFQDTALTVPATSNGQTVQGWRDQSGAGNNLTSPSGAGHACTLDTVNGLNNVPAVAFDGTSSCLLKVLGASFGQPVTVYIVARLDSEQGNNGTLWDLTNNAGVCARGPVLSYQAGSALDAIQIGAGNWGLTSYRLSCITINGGLSSTRLDLKQIVTTSPAGTRPITQIVLGQKGLVLNQNAMKCHVCEMLVYGAAHTPAQIAQTEAYLVGRYPGFVAPPPVGPVGVATAKTSGAIGDGNSHPLGSFFATLAAAQAVYPHVTSLTQELDWAAIQQAINLQSSSGSADPAYLEQGNYVVNYPVVVSNPGLRGDGVGSRVTAGAPGGMPALVLAGSLYPLANSASWAAVPTQASLVTGPGVAYRITRNQWINLRDFVGGDVDGLTQMCVEFYLYVNNIPPGLNTVAVSYGFRTTSESATYAFGVWVNSSSQIQASMTCGGVIVTVASSAISTATVYHVALTYDGSTLRLFVAGVLAASAAATGTVTQRYSEDFTIGDAVSRWPDGSAVQTVVDGVIDSFRLSKVARYTANFTAPAAKLSADGNTLLLCNFDNIVGPIIGVTTAFGQGYTFHRGIVGDYRPTTLKDLSISSQRGAGFFMAAATSSTVENIVTGVDGVGRTGGQVWNNCYTSLISNLTVSNSNRYGLALAGACSEMTILHPNIKCTGALGLGGTDWGGTVVGGTVFGCPKISVLAKGDLVSLTLIGGPDIGDEGSTNVPDDGLLMSGVETLCISGGGGAFLSSGISPITIDGTAGFGGGIAIVGYAFWMTAGTPAAIRVPNAPRSCVLSGCNQFGAGALKPWATSPTNFVVLDGGITAFTGGTLSVGAAAPAASAKLQADSTTQGFLPPRMTTTQKNAIASPAEGLTVYDMTLHAPYFWNGSVWVAF